MEQEIQVLEKKTTIEYPAAKCPFCGTVRAMLRPTQLAMLCPNKDCLTKTGKRRSFWLYKLSTGYNGPYIERVNEAK